MILALGQNQLPSGELSLKNLERIFFFLLEIMSENCHNQLCRHVKMTLYSKYETRIFFLNVPGTVAFVVMNSCLWSPKGRQSKEMY